MQLVTSGPVPSCEASPSAVCTVGTCSLFTARWLLPSLPSLSPNPDSSNWGPVITKSLQCLWPQWIRSMDRFTHRPLRACSQHLPDKNRHNPLLTTAEPKAQWWMAFPNSTTLPNLMVALAFTSAIISIHEQTFRLEAEDRGLQEFQIGTRSHSLLKKQGQTSCHLLWERSNMVHFGWVDVHTIHQWDSLLSSGRYEQTLFLIDAHSVCHEGVGSTFPALPSFFAIFPLHSLLSIYLNLTSPRDVPISHSACLPVCRSLLLNQTVEWL